MQETLGDSFYLMSSRFIVVKVSCGIIGNPRRFFRRNRRARRARRTFLMREVWVFFRKSVPKISPRAGKGRGGSRTKMRADLGRA